MKRNILILKSFVFVFSKDVRLPVQLQRAMAAEAEAAREARAKVRHSDRQTKKERKKTGLQKDR
jgi:hypothetical protein